MRQGVRTSRGRDITPSTVVEDDDFASAFVGNEPCLVRIIIGGFPAGC